MTSRTMAWRNVFRVAHPLLDGSKFRSDADRLNSSQAFCWSVWGAVLVPEGRAVLDVVCDLLGDAAVAAALRAGPTFCFEEDDRSVLNEFGAGKSTLDLRVGAPALVMTVESKLTEDLDRCSQMKAKAGAKNCTGILGPSSDLKPMPVT